MARNTDTQAAPAALEARIASLERRLEDGEQRIDAAASRGENVAAWEEFWLRLLREYELLHDRLDAMREPDRVAA